MTDLYDAYQALYERIEQIERRDDAGARLHAADPERINTLRALKDQLQRTATALEAAVFDLQNRGHTNPDLSRSLSITNHCAAGAAQLLIAAIDRQEEIRASVDDMNASTEELVAIGTDTQSLIENLGQVTSVVETAGKVLELIKS